ncbi:hypothetical protein COE51_08340 [Bacillus pseudomycoides]|nr:hypothetical protein COE51_08340 [Bacillus pseudomycoides]
MELVVVKYLNYNYENHMLLTHQVLKLIDLAIFQKKGLSLARFGIGEITYLTSKASTVLVQQFECYKSYAGITSSPEEIRRQLIQALKTTDIAGLISTPRLDFWGKTTKQVLQDLQFIPMKVCCAWVMHDFVGEGMFWEWIRDKKMVLVGRRSEHAKILFQRQGIQVVDTINLEGYKDLDKVQNYLAQLADWEIALISAGIPATILAPRVAKTTGKVAIDFGHALDILLDGKNFNHFQLVQEWENRCMDSDEYGNDDNSK